MNFKDIGVSLREYNKWRRGKGRKYSQPGFPFDADKIGNDIAVASSVMSRLPPTETFLALEGVFQFYLSKSEWVRRPVPDDERNAIKSFRKVIRHFAKTYGNHEIEEDIL